MLFLRVVGSGSQGDKEDNRDKPRAIRLIGIATSPLFRWTHRVDDVIEYCMGFRCPGGATVFEPGVWIYA